MAAFDGEIEEDNILARINGLVGGRVWETQVPDDTTLPREEDGSGGVKVYIIVRFAEPGAAAQGRNIASGEQGQPQLLSFSVTVYGDDADAVKETSREQRRLLVDFVPSDTSTPIRSSGGNAFGDADTPSVPTRYRRITFYRTIFNH